MTTEYNPNASVSPLALGKKPTDVLTPTQYQGLIGLYHWYQETDTGLQNQQPGPTRIRGMVRHLYFSVRKAFAGGEVVLFKGRKPVAIWDSTYENAADLCQSLYMMAMDQSFARSNVFPYSEGGEGACFYLHRARKGFERGTPFSVKDTARNVPNKRDIESWDYFNESVRFGFRMAIVAYQQDQNHGTGRLTIQTKEVGQIHLEWDARSGEWVEMSDAPQKIESIQYPNGGERWVTGDDGEMVRQQYGANGHDLDTERKAKIRKLFNADLTNTERLILCMLARGNNMRQIESATGMPEGTIRSAKHRMACKIA